jgi:hypothetical protein
MALEDMVDTEGNFDIDAANKVLDDYAQDNKQTDSSPVEETSNETVKDASPVDAAVETKDGDGDWVTGLAEDMRELVNSLGLTDDQIREFSGPEEIERHANLLDKQLMRLGETKRPGESQEAALEAQEPAQKQLEKVERAVKQERDEQGRFVSAEKYIPLVTADDFDEGLAGEFQRIAEHFNERVAKLESLLQQNEERSRRSEVQQHDTLIDTLGHEDLFGTVEKPRSTEQQENRVKLLRALKILRNGMESVGQSVSVTPTLLKRALNQEFADQLSTKQRQSLTKKIQDQSKRKLGGGRGRSSLSEQMDWSGDRTKDPVLLEAFRAMERESGVK